VIKIKKIRDMEIKIALLGEGKKLGLGVFDIEMIMRKEKEPRVKKSQ
jgi:hypothetical protein